MTYDQARRQRLAQRLKEVRQKLGFSATVASATIAARGLKCSRGTLLAWERGTGPTSREPFASDLIVIAAVYGCLVSEFFAAARDDRPGVSEALDHAGG